MSVSTIPFVKIYEDFLCAKCDENLKKCQNNIKTKDKPSNKKNKKRYQKLISGDDYYDMWVMFNNNA